MDISLEKIDAVVDRTGVSYKEAKDALQVNDGDVIEAIIYLEQKSKSSISNISDAGEQVLNKIKETLRKGNVTKIIVKKDGNVIMNIPVTAGAIGTVLAPYLALLGFGTALISKCSFEIVKQDGEIVNVNEKVDEKVNEIKDNLKKDDKQ